MHSGLTQVLQGQGGNYIYPFFWQHGEDHDTLRREIEKIHQSGIGAVCVESRPHEDFCGPGWWSDLGLILEECQKRNMKVWVLDDKHFPSGYANGTLADKDLSLRTREISEQHLDYMGPVTDGAALVDARLKPEDRIVAILACKRTGQEEILTGEVIDITDGYQDGMVYFDLPEGPWRILFAIEQLRPDDHHRALYCDPLSSASMDCFIEAVYEPHYQQFSEYFGNTLEAFFSDEPSFGNHGSTFEGELGIRYTSYPWRNELLPLLEEQLGENPMLYLPALWYNLGDVKTARFRTIYMDVITRLYEQNFCQKLGNWCKEHGVDYTGHIIEDNNAHSRTGAAAGHFFRSLEGQTIAGIDVVLHQILPGLPDGGTGCLCSYEVADSEFFHYALAKLGASLAHLGVDKKGRSMCEIYGAYGWAEGNKMMKWLTDHMLVRGINYFVPHAFSPTHPDPDCPPHFYGGGENPQYHGFGYLMKYMNRLCHLLSDGTHIATAAILYQAEGEWSGAEYMKMQVPAKVLYDSQIDYDFLSADYLMHATAKDGQLVYGGEAFPLFLIPYARCLPYAVIEKAYQLSTQGVPVIYIDGLPEFCPEGRDISPFIQLSDTLRVLALDELVPFVFNHQLQDIQLSEPNRFLRAYHYQKGDNDLYFFVNESTNSLVDTRVLLNGFSGGEYVSYDAYHNKAVRHTSESGSIPLLLAPYEAVLLQLGPATLDIPLAPIPSTLQRSDSISGPFVVSTATQANFPTFTPYNTLDTLENMTGPKHLPHFSGHFQYEFTAELQPKEGEQVLLDLGNCGETATVTVNETEIGVEIAPPYRFDITEAITPGKNTFVVTIANHLGWEQRDMFSLFLLFEPSGLLGPVSVEYRK